LSEKKLFVRKATGLVREVGPLTAVIICLCNTIGLGWQKRIFQFTGPAPVPETTYFLGMPPMAIAFLIGGIVILFSTVSFAILSAAMPRSGGGYVVISRTINPFVGYVSSWVEFLSIAWSFGIIGVAVFEGLGVFGAVAGIAVPMTDVQMFWGGLALVILFTAIGALGVRMAGYLLQAMFWIPAILTFYVMFLLFSGAGNPALVTAGMKTVVQHTPTEYVQAALNQGLNTYFKGSYFDAVSIAMLGAYWSYIGYAASTFVAGEIKEANKTLPRTLFIAGILIVLVYMAVSMGTYLGTKVAVTPDGNWSLFSAFAFLSWSGKGSLAAAGLPGIKAWSTVVAGFSGAGMGLASLNILLVIFGVFWIANDIPPFILTASRILFAMSFDRVMPESLSAVNERFHSPVNATIVTGIVGLLGVASESGVFSVGASYNPWKNVMLDNIFSTGVGTTDLYDGIFFTVFALALLFFPFRKKEIFDKAPWKPGGVATAVIIGLVAFIGNLYLDYAFLFSSRGSFNLGALPYSKDPFTDGFALWFTIFLIVVGGLVYGYYKMRARTTGVDYSTIFTEIPPE
jgi:APA family basic amino acid/polyamine antiporter